MKKRLISLIAVIVLFAAALSLMSGCNNKRKGDSSADLQHSAEIIIEPLPSDMFPDNQEPSTPAASSEAAEPAKVKETDYLVLVNKENKLPDGWEDVVKLVKEKNDVKGYKLTDDQDYIRDREFEVEEKTYKAFRKLQKSLAKDGIIILLDSTYRSVERQQEIWDEFMEEKGEEYTKKYVAVPGYSEHHTGLAIDICIVVDGKVINDNDDMIAQKDIFAKIHERLAEYGFILRYPEGMEDVTGYSYEPWHFRYVGKNVASVIAEHGWTLEQYHMSGATD